MKLVLFCAFAITSIKDFPLIWVCYDLGYFIFLKSEQNSVLMRMICCAFEITAKNILRAVQDFNSVSLLLHYFPLSWQCGNCSLSIYGYEKTLRDLVKRTLENIIKLNKTIQKRFQQSSHLVFSGSSCLGVTGNSRTCIIAIANCSIYLKIIVSILKAWY